MAYTEEKKDTKAEKPEDNYEKDFLSDLYGQLQEVEGEVSERNAEIEDRDDYIYGDKLERALDIPIGHDFTKINWLKRAVAIHTTMFMGRPFQIVSTYDTRDLSMAGDGERPRLEIENKKEKSLAELRRNACDSIIRDNGGHALFLEGAESASAVGSWILKTYWDEDEEKFHIEPVEAVENCYVVWKSDNFREFSFFAYVYQLKKDVAAKRYGLEADDLTTSPMGSPFGSDKAGTQIGGPNSTLGAKGSNGPTSGQPMVTILEGTGTVAGWGTNKGKLTKVQLGKENDVNCVYVGGKLVRLIDKPKKLPRYYIFPNKRERRRAWGVSDVSESAIQINLTYIETLSDWRTVASKVNFPKFKGFNFGPDTTAPKFASRKIQLLPLSEGQDMVPLQTGDANGVDWTRQLDELKQLFVRETGVSRVLFDDPSVTLNSNQALLTSMKPTSDMAENKKQLWAPILSQLFTDALNTLAENKKEFEQLTEGDWNLKIQWPSVMQKEDPVFQQMLLNRWNAGTMSLESYLEAQGETKEEIDRIRDDFYDPVTAAAIGKSLPQLAQFVLGLPQSQGAFMDQSATQANNTPGTQPVSQPGSGATPVSPQGALNQTNQQLGG